MKAGEAEFLAALRATFKVEAAEHSQSIATGLLDLERTPPAAAQHGLIATVFRAAHSLKGAARAVDFAEVEASCQTLEDLFAGWKGQQGNPAPGSFDTAHRTLDAINAALSVRQPDVPAPPGREAPVIAPALPAASEDTVRISIAKLDAQLMEAEEMLTAKLTTAQRAKDLRDLGQRFHAWQEEWAVVEPIARTLGQGGTAAAIAPGLGRVLEFVAWNRD